MDRRCAGDTEPVHLNTLEDPLLYEPAAVAPSELRQYLIPLAERAVVEEQNHPPRLLRDQLCADIPRLPERTQLHDWLPRDALAVSRDATVGSSRRHTDRDEPRPIVQQREGGIPRVHDQRPGGAHSLAVEVLGYRPPVRVRFVDRPLVQPREVGSQGD
jgi:hypothetical protein